LSAFLASRFDYYFNISWRLKMIKIEVFDPAMCCSSGVCGADVDQRLVDFATNVAWAQQQGINIKRYNLGQQPIEFANNPTVKSFLQRSGQEALPLILMDGEIALAGRYPDRNELARWAGLAPVPAPKKSGGCCGGSAASNC
jgi:hypothetical protein